MPTAADAAILGSWVAVLAHNAMRAARAPRPGDGVRWALGVALVAAIVAAGTYLERGSGGRFPVPAALTLAGVTLAIGGAILHVRARRALGSAWSPAVVAGADVLVEHGPYAVVRHPLYLALGLLALGTVAAHPSLPTCAGGAGLLAGLALKIAREERALASALGARWTAYRARVPCLVPRLR